MTQVAGRGNGQAGPDAGLAVPRRVIGAGVLAALAGLFAGRARAAPAASGPAASGPTDSTSAETTIAAMAVAQLILRERQARETGDFATEAACFHPDAVVDVSWFSGSGAEFVAAGRRAASAASRGESDADAGRPVFFDSMSPAAVTVRGARALADTACAVHAFARLGGVDAHVTSYTRLLWRARRDGGEWRIAGLRGIYLRDTLEACNPAQIPVIDLARLATFRSSYRHLAYLLSAIGRPVRDDRAGLDRPDLVAALRAGERAWLNG